MEEATGNVCVSCGNAVETNREGKCVGCAGGTGGHDHGESTNDGMSGDAA